MSTNLKKDFAKTLYLQGVDIKEIAQRAGVVAKTVYGWAKQGEWDALKTTLIITKKEELGRLYRQLAELNSNIEERERGKRYASVKEADTIAKLGAAIRQLENDSSIAAIIDSCIELTEFIRSENDSSIDAFVDITDRFIQQKLTR